MTGTPAAASRACSARTYRTWIQIITDRPGGQSRARRPRVMTDRGRRPPRDRPAGQTPAGWPSAERRGRCAAAVQVAGTQEDSAAQNLHTVQTSFQAKYSAAHMPDSQALSNLTSANWYPAPSKQFKTVEPAAVVEVEVLHIRGFASEYPQPSSRPNHLAKVIRSCVVVPDTPPTPHCHRRSSLVAGCGS
jgi:hypothetical protein